MSDVPFKIATTETARGLRAAAVVGETVHDIADILGSERYGSLQAILDDWVSAEPILTELAARASVNGTPLADAVLAAPLPFPVAIYCAGANYRDHAAEMVAATGIPASDPRADGGQPWFFLKSPRAVVGPGAAVPFVAAPARLDWEAELGVAIGRSCRNVTAAQAMDFVAGFTCANDISDRAATFRPQIKPGSPFHADWTAHKSFDGACPLGPWLVPAKFVGDPMDLPISLSVNGAVVQQSNTSQMIFSIAEQIAALSRRITLHPGDLVLTGTPAGVGMARGVFLQPGDEMRVEIGKIGVLANTVTKPSAVAD